MDFMELGVECRLTEILNERGITAPTTIQMSVIPAALNQRSIIARSQTGSGKSLAYLLPMLQNTRKGGQLLILLPTRELAAQIGELSAPLTHALGLNQIVIYGGVEYEKQKSAMSHNPQVIIATPGRLQDLINQNIITLDNLSRLVIDEVDQMVSLGFKEPIIELANYRTQDAQCILLSATLPQSVMETITTIAPNGQLIENNEQPLSAQNITHTGYYVEQSLMMQLMLHVVKRCNPRRAIVFCRSRKMADNITQQLCNAGYKSESIHSDRSQAAREHILSRFKSYETTLLVATDVIARGIDIEDVTHIFNFGLPQTPEQYLHRSGRTARAGKSGESISFICPDELKMVNAICSLMKRQIIISTTHPYTTQELTKQLAKRR